MYRYYTNWVSARTDRPGALLLMRADPGAGLRIRHIEGGAAHNTRILEMIEAKRDVPIPVGSSACPISP